MSFGRKLRVPQNLPSIVHFHLANMSEIQNEAGQNVYFGLHIKKRPFSKRFYMKIFSLIHAYYFDENIFSLGRLVGLQSVEPYLFEICFSYFGWFGWRPSRG